MYIIIIIKQHAPKYARKHRSARGKNNNKTNKQTNKKQTNKQEQFRIDSNDLGFICHGASIVSSYKRKEACSYLNCLCAWLQNRAQELCESGGGRPGLPSLTVLMVSVGVKQH